MLPAKKPVCRRLYVEQIMKKTVLSFVAVVLLLVGCDAEDQTLVVSPDGMSFEEARDAVRKIEAAQDVTVIVRGGTYRLTKPLVFTPMDSAGEGFTVTYKTAEGETPVISSGVPVTGWKKCESDPAHLAPAAAGKLWVADFPKGIDSFKTMFDEQGRLPRAIGPEHKPLLPRDDPRVTNKRTLYFPQGSLRDYENMQDAEIWIVPTFQWCHNVLPLESVNVAEGFAKTAIEGTYPLAQREKGYDPSRFRVCNVPDVLDEPGEWFMDSKVRKIWFWPRDDNQLNGVVVPVLNELLVLDGDEAAGTPVRGLVFDGLTFKHADREVWTDDDARLQHDWEAWNKGNSLVRFQTSENCALKNCLLTDSGGGGVRLDLYSQNNRIENCEISNLGATGVALIGDKVGEDFVNRKNTIHNNHIHHVGLENHHCAAVFMWQSGENEITHNRIHHTPYNGFSVGGIMPPAFSSQWRESSGRELTRVINYALLPFEEMEKRGDEDVTWTMIFPYLYCRDNLFAYNEVYRNMEILGDGNPFYIRMTAPGNIIRRNYFHDVYGTHSAGAIRFDGQESGNLCEENVFYRCTGAGIAFHKANRMINNIMVDILGNVQTAHGGKSDAHTAADIETTAGYFFRCTWGPKQPDIGVPNYTKSEIKNNVMVQISDEFAPFYSDTSEWPRWQTDFTKIKKVDSNLMWAPNNPLALTSWLTSMQAAGVDADAQIADPMFVDVSVQDFRFKPESPALGMGIKSVDRREAGLTDEFPAQFREWVLDDQNEPLEEK